MIHTLESGTDAANMVLFDPEVLPAGRAEFGQEEVEAAAAEGRLVHWYTAADGSFRLRLYVEEPVPAELASRAVNGVTGRLLRVPGGRVYFAGVELLLDGETAWRSEASAGLPPGDYVIDAFEVDWTEGDDQAFQRHWEARVGVLGARLVSGLEVATAVALLVTLGSLIPAVVLLFTRPSGLLEFAPWLLGLWVVILVVWRLPGVRRIQGVREELQQGMPDGVVALRRVEEPEAPPARGASFGEGLGDLLTPPAASPPRGWR